MRISDWSSDVCSSDLLAPAGIHVVHGNRGELVRAAFADQDDLAWAEQARQLGTRHAVQQALPAIPDEARVLVLYGDVPLIRSDERRVGKECVSPCKTRW